MARSSSRFLLWDSKGLRREKVPLLKSQKKISAVTALTAQFELSSQFTLHETLWVFRLVLLFFKTLIAQLSQGECTTPDPRTPLFKATWQAGQGRNPSQFNCFSGPAALSPEPHAGCVPLCHLHRAFSFCFCLAPISWCLLGDRCGN